jgi:hypothetical protein
MRLELGQPVRFVDGPLGQLVDLVLDPRRLRITHLVVAPRHRHGLARLVSIDGVTANRDSISLACTLEEAERLPLVREFAYVRPGELRQSSPAGTRASRPPARHSTQASAA